MGYLSNFGRKLRKSIDSAASSFDKQMATNSYLLAAEKYPDVFSDHWKTQSMHLKHQRNYAQIKENHTILYQD